MPYDFPIRKKTIDYDLLALPDYEGVYQLGPDDYRIVTVFEDELYIHTYGESQLKLPQQAPDTFFFENDNTQTAIFNRDSTKGIAALELQLEGTMLVAPRLTDAQASGFIIRKKQTALDQEMLHRYVGTYGLELTDDTSSSLLSLIIEEEPFNSFIAEFVNQTVEIFACSETEFLHRTADFLLRFSIDDAGTVTGCSITLGGKIVTLRKVL